jgi:hypothetical protein
LSDAPAVKNEAARIRGYARVSQCVRVDRVGFGESCGRRATLYVANRQQLARSHRAGLSFHDRKRAESADARPQSANDRARHRGCEENDVTTILTFHFWRPKLKLALLAAATFAALC